MTRALVLSLVSLGFAAAALAQEPVTVPVEPRDKTLMPM